MTNAQPSQAALDFADALRKEPLHPNGHYYQVALAFDRFAASRPSRAVRYSKYCGPMDAAECRRVMDAPLYKHGDAVLVWVNEGDLISHGEEVPGTPGEGT